MLCNIQRKVRFVQLRILRSTTWSRIFSMSCFISLINYCLFVIRLRSICWPYLSPMQNLGELRTELFVGQQSFVQNALLNDHWLCNSFVTNSLLNPGTGRKKFSVNSTCTIGFFICRSVHSIILSVVSAHDVDALLIRK